MMRCILCFFAASYAARVDVSLHGHMNQTSDLTDRDRIQSDRRAPPKNCKPLSDPSNDACRESVTWAFNDGRASGVEYENLYKITWVIGASNANQDDFQKLYYCGGVKHNPRCGTPPCGCSQGWCDDCNYFKP